jgi:hypothetical protein
MIMPLHPCKKMGAAGILRGSGVPYKWANQTWFYPERMVSEYEWKNGLYPIIQKSKMSLLPEEQ